VFEFLKNPSQRVLLVGDHYVSCDIMQQALNAAGVDTSNLKKVFWGPEDDGLFSVNQLELEAKGPEAVPYPRELDDAIGSADVMMIHFCPMPRDLIKRAKRLKVLLVSRGGLEHVDVGAATEMGIPVVNVIRNCVPVAEFTLGLMLSVTRNIAQSHKLLTQGVWERHYPNSDHLTCLQNMKVGLAGLGNVGIELALRLKALDVSMLAYDEFLDRERLMKNGLGNIAIVSSLEELFAQSDIVSLHLRLVPDTCGIIDRRLFSLMKPDAYLINTARGGLVNQDDLLKALESGTIAGAALDVYDSEPLSADSGLTRMENVTLTPHIAGTTREALSHSPFLLARELLKIIDKGITDRIVNYQDLSM